MIFKNIIFIIVFIILGFTGGCVASKDNTQFEPRISLIEVNSLSDIEVANQLFIAYLDHFKVKPFYDKYKITNYKDIELQKLDNHIGGYEELFRASFSVQQGFLGEWDVGGRATEDGWIHKGYYIELTKENSEAKLRVIGTGL